jgi:integrase
MRGSTRKRGRVWWAYWDLPPDHDTGKRRQKAKGGFRTQKAAQAHLATVVGQVNDGLYFEPSRASLAAFMAQEWLPAVRWQLRPLTVRKYAQIVRTHVKGRDIGAVPLRALNPGHFTALYAELEDGGLSASTMRVVHAVLRRALQDAVRWEKIRRNPAAAADPPAVPRSSAEAWTASELRRFLQHAEGDRLFALWRLAATTGMRRGELLAVTWQNVDLDACWLTRHPAAGADPGWGVVRPTEVATKPAHHRAGPRYRRRARGSPRRAGA